MTHPLLIACGLNPVLRHKNRVLSSMVKKRKHGGALGLSKSDLGVPSSRAQGSGFKKDEPEMTIMPVPRRALKFRS